MRYIFTQLLLLLIFISFAKEPKALIWEITKPGLEHKSYLMGTIHISDKAVIDFFEEYKAQTFDSCKQVALEISMDGAVFEGLFELLISEPDYQIRDYLSDSEYDKLSVWLKKEHGMKLSRFEQIKPIFFYFLINDFNVASNNQVFLDQHIFELAKQQHKNVTGLETAGEQIAAFDAIPYEDQFELLMESLEAKKALKNAYDKLVKHYLNQNLRKLDKSLSKEMPESFYSILIDNRNKNMIDAMLPLLHEEATFVAVGAGHLPGEGGLIQLLRDKGFTLRAISK